MPARSYVPFLLTSCSVVLTLFLVMRRQVSDADPKALEDEKKKNLSGQQKSPHPEDAPGWNEVLAVSCCFPLFHFLLSFLLGITIFHPHISFPGWN
jgi:hypothetical protein